MFGYIKVSRVEKKEFTKHFISGSEVKTLIIWNFQEKRQETVLIDHKRPIYSVALASDDKCIITCFSHRIGLWNLQKRKIKAFISDYADRRNDIAIKSAVKSSIIVLVSTVYEFGTSKVKN